MRKSYLNSEILSELCMKRNINKPHRLTYLFEEKTFQFDEMLLNDGAFLQGIIILTSA